MSIDVIRLAKEADCLHVNLTGDKAAAVERLERFAALVAAAEREECAKVCDDLIDKKEEARAVLRAVKAIESGDEDDMLAALKHESNVSLYGAGISKCAAAIRARKPA